VVALRHTVPFSSMSMPTVSCLLRILIPVLPGNTAQAIGAEQLGAPSVAALRCAVPFSSMSMLTIERRPRAVWVRCTERLAYWESPAAELALKSCLPGSIGITAVALFQCPC